MIINIDVNFLLYWSDNQRLNPEANNGIAYQVAYSIVLVVEPQTKKGV